MDDFTFQFTGDRDERAELSRDLADWLGSSGPLRGGVTLRTAPPEPGELGGVADAVVVAAATAPLARPFFTWLVERTRRRAISVSITRVNRFGGTLKVTAGDAAEAERVLNVVKDFLDDHREEEIE